MMKVTITGGAGFIGGHLAKRLLKDGVDVTILDNFSPQIHGNSQDLPTGLRGQVRLVRGDVRDRDCLTQAILGAEAVVHLAAETGTGQSMYQVAGYSDSNIQGTAVLMDLLVNHRDLNVTKVVVASSRAIYGEGRYCCAEHGIVYPPARRKEVMAAGGFDPLCPVCGKPASSLPTAEDTPFSPSSLYGLTKQVQEQMVLLMSQAVGFDAVALRYQNVYGPGQSLKNPYTGILAVFSGLARKGEPIRVFEDGLETRDFVFIDDVVEATYRALCPAVKGNHALNVGSGMATTVKTVVQEVIAYFSSRSVVQVTGEFRAGDIRHNVASLARVKEVLGFSPKVTFAEGLGKFLDWAMVNEFDITGYRQSLDEMRNHNLMNG